MIKPGDTIQDRYHVIQELNGKGSFGKIFEVEDLFLGGQMTPAQHKVMKVLNLENFSNQEQKKLVELFQRAAKVLKKMNHQGIPQVGEDGYFVFRCPHSQKFLHALVMERINGQDLEDLIKELTNRNQNISEEQAIDWLEQLVNILNEIHPTFFHRDIKPENIMLKPNNQLVLIDFGAVKAMAQTYIQQQGSPNPNPTSIGTLGYQPTEQQLGQTVLQSDFFALGRTFVHLLTNKPPWDFQEDSRTGKLIWRNQAPQVSESLANLIDWLMEPNWKNRPENGQEILAEIEKLKVKRVFYSPWSELAGLLSVVLNFILLGLLIRDNTLPKELMGLFLVIIIILAISLLFPRIYQTLSQKFK